MILFLATVLIAAKDCFEFLLAKNGVALKDHGPLGNFQLGLGLQSLFLLLLLRLLQAVFVLLLDSFLLEGLELLHRSQSNLIRRILDFGPFERLLFVLLLEALTHILRVVLADEGNYAFRGLVIF